MLTKCIRNYISKRLGVFVKYTVSGGFHWDNIANRFIPITAYLHLTWRSTYHHAHLFQVLMLSNLYYQMSTCLEIPEAKHKLTHQNEVFVEKNYLL